MTLIGGYFSKSAALAPRRARRRRTGRLLSLLCWTALIGCAGLTPSYEGTPVRSENRLALAAPEDASRVWRTRDVAIHFTAVLEGKTFAVDGRVERLGPIKNFARIDDFRVSIHFIDNAGIILDSRLLWAAGIGADDNLVQWRFSRRYVPPPQTAAFGFSYRGSFSENGEDGGRSSWEVRQGP